MSVDGDSGSQGSAELGLYVTEQADYSAVPLSAQRLAAPEVGVGSSAQRTGLLTSHNIGAGKVRGRKWRRLQVA